MSKKAFETVPVRPSEITPEHVYLSRRDFLKTMGVTSAFALLLAACGGKPPQATDTPVATTGCHTYPRHFGPFYQRLDRRVGRLAHPVRFDHPLQQLLRVFHQ